MQIEHEPLSSLRLLLQRILAAGSDANVALPDAVAQADGTLLLLGDRLRLITSAAAATLTQEAGTSGAQIAGAKTQALAEQLSGALLLIAMGGEWLSPSLLKPTLFAPTFAGTTTGLSASDLLTGTLPIARIGGNAITLDKLEQMAQATFMMRAAGAGTGNVIHGTVAQALAALGFEAGTGSPALTFATPGDLSVTYSIAASDYVRIPLPGGNYLYFGEFAVITSAFTHTSASGNLSITGLPATVGSTLVGFGAMRWRGITKANYTQLVLLPTPATATGLVIASGSGQTPSPVAAADMPSGGTVDLRGNFMFTT